MVGSYSSFQPELTHTPMPVPRQKYKLQLGGERVTISLPEQKIAANSKNQRLSIALSLKMRIAAPTAGETHLIFSI